MDSPLQPQNYPFPVSFAEEGVDGWEPYFGAELSAVLVPQLALAEVSK